MRKSIRCFSGERVLLILKTNLQPMEAIINKFCGQIELQVSLEKTAGDKFQHLLFVDSSNDHPIVHVADMYSVAPPPDLQLWIP